MGAPEHITDRDVTEALAALPEITAAQVAGALGVGRSTAAKRLVRLEAAGMVRRAPGGRVGGAKVADRWSLAGPPAAADSEAGSVESAPTGPGPDGTTTGDTGDTGDTGTGTSTEPDGAQAPTISRAGDAGAGGTDTRLAPGSLRTLVHDYLAARPAQSFGPSGIAKSLGRSAGAVSNALSAMAEGGEVRLVAERPRRYRIAGQD